MLPIRWPHTRRQERGTKMAQHVCPWWAGYFLASPIRRMRLDPEELLRPYLWAGMTVLEPGPGMGFFTIPVSQMIGEEGRVIAVDIQPRMLAALRRRAAKAGLAQRINTRLAHASSLGIADLASSVDFVLAFAVVHEMPSVEIFFREAALAMKPEARLLLVEPAGHVKPEQSRNELEAARSNGLIEHDQPEVRRSFAVLLTKRPPTAATVS
jgi:ubiquinone/menaquinone biosynthesis C-methylase UbiE